MKKSIKSILQSFGLLAPIQKFRLRKKEEAFQATYAKIDFWELNSSGLSLKFHSKDQYSKKWFYPRYDHRKIHEPIATNLFIEHLKPNSHVMDIGAHLGYFTCLASHLVKRGSVHAFEIDPQCYELIKNNLDLNKAENVIINKLAASDKNDFEKIPLLEEPNPGLMINAKGKEYINIPCTKIDDYIQSNDLTIDFIKIDVVGAEMKVLNGMKKVLKQDQLKLLIEVHVAHLENYFNTDYKDLLKLLINNGFELYNIDAHRASESKLKKINQQSTLSGNTMLWCVKNN